MERKTHSFGAIINRFICFYSTFCTIWQINYKNLNFFLDFFNIIMYYCCKKHYYEAVMSIDFVENYKKLSDEEIVKLINSGEYGLLQIIITR